MKKLIRRWLGINSLEDRFELEREALNKFYYKIEDKINAMDKTNISQSNNNEYESWKEYAFDKWGAIESDQDLIGYLRRFKDYVIDVPMDYKDFNVNGGYGFPSTLTEQEKMRLINTMLEMRLRYIIENERR